MDTTVQSYETSHCHDDGYAGRIDVVTGPSGRRRWPEHVKAAIVLESYRDGASVADVARKHGVSAPQLHSWRRAAREGLLPMPDDDALELMPVVVGASDDGDGRTGGGTIEIDISGVRICVAPEFDSDHLARVIAAVRAACGRDDQASRTSEKRSPVLRRNHHPGARARHQKEQIQC